VVVFPLSAVFSIGKTVLNRKIPTDAEFVSLLQAEGFEFFPLRIDLEAGESWRGRKVVDVIATARWGEQTYRFVAEYKQSGSPKSLSLQIAQVQQYATRWRCQPLVVVPYLAEEGLAQLQSAGVSGIDLCGNGVVVVPGELFVYRTGRPNQFRTEDEIKNVFRGNSSQVARVFLLTPQFESVGGLQREIERREGAISLGTVSKVCNTLEGLLVIDRASTPGTAARRLRLLQPDKLLDLLAENYVPPVVTRVQVGKTRLTPDEFSASLAASGAKVVRTGFGSVSRYAVMATEPMSYFYCSKLDATLAKLGGVFEPTERFANVSLSECADDTVYFDRRPGVVASPVQTYLELVTGDKRSRETAEQVRRAILAPLTDRGG
jgi:hypothetical protein